MRFHSWFSAVAVAAGLLLYVSAASAQQGGGFGGGGGGFGGGGGGGGFGGGGGGQGGQLGPNSSLLNNLQSPTGLPTIMNRPAQGTFGTRTLGSPTRQRFRMMMGRSQAGGGVSSQYANSGAFSQTRRGTLQGSGMLTVGGLTGSNLQQQQQQRAGQPNQQQTARRSNAAPLTKKLTVRVGFDAAGPAPQQITGGLQRRLGQVTAPDSTSVLLQGRTAVLRGSVATDHDRDLAERLALLEPGVDAVRNELTTSPALPSPQNGRQSKPPARQAPVGQPPLDPSLGPPASSPDSGPSLGPGNSSSGS